MVSIKPAAAHTSRFSADFLGDLARRVGEINFNIRFPGGLVDLAKQRMEDGGYMSRRWVAMLSGAPVDADGYPTAHPAQGEVSSGGAEG